MTAPVDYFAFAELREDLQLQAEFFFVEKWVIFVQFLHIFKWFLRVLAVFTAFSRLFAWRLKRQVEAVLLMVSWKP